MDTSNPAVFDAVPSRKALPPVKRQHRSPELKLQIVQESLAPGASVARVARAPRRECESGVRLAASVSARAAESREPGEAWVVGGSHCRGGSAGRERRSRSGPSRA